MTWEAFTYIQNFTDSSYKKNIDTQEQKKLNDNNIAVSDSIQNTVVFNQKVSKAEIRKQLQEEFGDIFKKENIEHVKEHVVANKRFAEKYVENPAAALKDEQVKVKFNAKEAAEIENLLIDENSLTLFAELSRYEEFSGQDVVECLKRYNKMTERERKNLFFASMSADEVEKMDPKKMARKIAANMRKLARMRKSMKAEDKAFIAEMMSKVPKECEEHIDEIIENRRTYKDSDVTDMCKNMEEMSDDEKADYTQNISDLSKIKDKDNKPKYKGSVNVKVAKNMVDEPKAKNAIMDTAKRDDMDGEHLIGISSNLVLNPNMIAAYEAILGAKSSDGEYKFGKEALLGQTDYMLGKSLYELEEYAGKLLKYAKHDNISGEDAASYAQQVLENPSLESQIDSLVETKASGISDNMFASQNEDSLSGEVVNVSYFNSTENRPVNNLFTENSNEQEDKTEYYKKLADDFRARYGKAADTMISLCKEKPEVAKALFLNPNITFQEGMNILQKYGSNVDLISAIAKNPRSVDKIKLSSASITNPQLTSLAQLSDKRGVDFVVKMIQKYSPAKAITICSSPDSEKIKTAMTTQSNNEESDKFELYHFSRDLLA